MPVSSFDEADLGQLYQGLTLLIHPSAAPARRQGLSVWGVHVSWRLAAAMLRVSMKHRPNSLATTAFCDHSLDRPRPPLLAGGPAIVAYSSGARAAAWVLRPNHKSLKHRIPMVADARTAGAGLAWPPALAEEALRVWRAGLQKPGPVRTPPGCTLSLVCRAWHT